MSMNRPALPDLPSLSDPNAGGRVDDLGHHEVITAPQAGSDLRPYVGVQDRPLFGGVRTAHAPLHLMDAPRYDGGHVELINRRSVVVLAPHEQQQAEAPAVLPSLRVPPVSDPYGRLCANARAAGGSR